MLATVMVVFAISPLKKTCNAEIVKGGLLVWQLSGKEILLYEARSIRRHHREYG